MDPDSSTLDSRFRISSTAWWIGLTSIVLAVIAIMATPGIPVRGCFHSKGCFPLPEPPLLYGGLVLGIGSFLSTLVGRVPRHWVVGWSLTLTGLSTLVIAGIPVAGRMLLGGAEVARHLSSFERAFTIVLAMSLMFVALGVVMVTTGLLASMLVSGPRSTPVSYVAEADPRPRWVREVETVRAALLGCGASHLGSDESQLVAELAYALRSGALEVPTHLEVAGAQLLDVLSRSTTDFDMRGSVIRLLDRALTFADQSAPPYRAC